MRALLVMIMLLTLSTGAIAVDSAEEPGDGCDPCCVTEACCNQIIKAYFTVKYRPMCWPWHRCVVPCEPCAFEPCIPEVCHLPVTPWIPCDYEVCIPKACHKPAVTVDPCDPCAEEEGE